MPSTRRSPRLLKTKPDAAGSESGGGQKAGVINSKRSPREMGKERRGPYVGKYVAALALQGKHALVSAEAGDGGEVGGGAEELFSGGAELALGVVDSIVGGGAASITIVIVAADISVGGGGWRKIRGRL